jgi:hypothetical protein
MFSSNTAFASATAATGTKVAHTSARARKRSPGEALTVPVRIRLLRQDGVSVSRGAVDEVGLFHTMSKVENTKCHVSALNDMCVEGCIGCVTL